MKILVCGARGFIGGHIAEALRTAGHDVVGTTSAKPRDGELHVDFARDTTTEAWLPRLSGFDAVVNAVGVLRDSPRRPMTPVHLLTPMALFAACVRVPVKRVIHVSALGIEASDTPYARTKCAADKQLLERTVAGQLDGVVLRPSVVYGPGGAGAAVFDLLSRSPVLPLPAPAMRSRIRPVHVDDVAALVVQLLGPGRSFYGAMPVVGPRELSLADFIDDLRAARGGAPARRFALPDRLMRCSARLGDACPLTPWGRQTLELLCNDNTGDVKAMQELLGREPRDPAQFVAAASATMSARPA